MIVLRFTRAGTNNKPFFRLVAAEARGPRDGKYLERLGTYNPKIKDETKKLNVDMLAVQAWLKKGAIPSETVAKYLKLVQN